MKKAACYCRVSTEEQAVHGTSLATQEEALRAYCKREGLEIHNIFIDDGQSGAILERPALQRLLSDARKKLFDVVLVYKTDRLSRSISQVCRLVLEDFQALGIGFRSITEHYDTTTPSGKMFFVQLASFADFERETIRERSKLGKRRLAGQGKAMVGTVPYGYTKDKDKNWIIHRDQARIYKQIVRWLLVEKLSTRKIAMRLIQTGVPSQHHKRGTWTQSYICSMLQKPIYKGQGTYGGVQFSMPPLIGAIQWQAVQDQLQANRHYTKPVVRHFALLKDLLFCGNCGRKFFPAAPRLNKSPGNYYCRSKRPEPFERFCGMPHGRQERFNNAVWNVVLRIVKDRRFLTKVLTANKLSDTGSGAVLEAELATINKSIQRKQEEIDRLLDLYGQTGSLTVGDLDRQVKRVKDAKEGLKLEAKRIQSEISKHALAITKIKDIEYMLSKAKARIDSLTQEERREFLLKVIDRVVVKLDPERGHRLEVRMKFRMKTDDVQSEIIPLNLTLSSIW